MSFTKAKAYLGICRLCRSYYGTGGSTATVVEAAGNDHSAVQLTIPELEQVANARGWVDVCKEAV